MRLWTIQHKKACKSLLEKGILVAQADDAVHDGIDDSFRRAYGWMAGKMLHLGILPLLPGTRYPVWAWYRWEGRRKRRDMRRNGYASRGTELVQLTIEIPDHEVLLSDFDLFHYALNYWYLPFDEADDADFEKKCNEVGYCRVDLQNLGIQTQEMLQLRELIVKSWDRILDLDREDEGRLYGGNKDKSIQAAFWQIKIDQVVEALPFIAR